MKLVVKIVFVAILVVLGARRADAGSIINHGFNIKPQNVLQFLFMSFTRTTGSAALAGINIQATVAAVPEPAPPLLLGSDRASLLAYGWRRRQLTASRLPRPSVIILPGVAG